MCLFTKFFLQPVRHTIILKIMNILKSTQWVNGFFFTDKLKFTPKTYLSFKKIMLSTSD